MQGCAAAPGHAREQPGELAAGAAAVVGAGAQGGRTAAADRGAARAACARTHRCVPGVPHPSANPSCQAWRTWACHAQPVPQQRAQAEPGQPVILQHRVLEQEKESEQARHCLRAVGQDLPAPSDPSDGQPARRATNDPHRAAPPSTAPRAQPEQCLQGLRHGCAATGPAAGCEEAGRRARGGQAGA